MGHKECGFHWASIRISEFVLAAKNGQIVAHCTSIDGIIECEDNKLGNGRTRELAKVWRKGRRGTTYKNMDLDLNILDCVEWAICHLWSKSSPAIGISLDVPEVDTVRPGVLASLHPGRREISLARMIFRELEWPAKNCQFPG
jgi:hypothetical protein